MPSLWLLWFFKVAFLVTSSHIPECPTVLDVIFMIDTSMNVPNPELRDTKEFIKNVIPYINPSTKGTHIGILSVSQSSVTRYSLSDKQDVSTIQRAVHETQSGIGQPHMNRAFQQATRSISEHRPAKQYKRLLVVASNGLYIHPGIAISSAQQPKDDGIVIISLWIGANFNKEQLESVATSKRHVVMAQSSRDETATIDLVSMICEANRKSEAIISYSAERSALKGHVIDIVHARNDFACAFSCLHTNNCFSFNFKESSRVCELNHSNKMTSPEDLTIDLDYSYYEFVFL